MIKKLVAILTIAGFLGLLSTAAMAASSDTLTVNYSVAAINELDITAASVTLAVSTATAGAQPSQATASTTYGITTNEASKKITCNLDTAMATGLTLKVTAAAPTGATSAGAVDISAATALAPATLVTGITKVAASGLALSFTLDATVAAGVVASSTKTLTMTIVAGV